MSKRLVYVGLFILGATVGAYLVFSNKKQVLEDLAGETKPTIITE